MLKEVYRWIKKEAMKPTSGPSRLGMGHVPPPPPKARAVTLRKAMELKAREENPAVKDAWEKYQITLKLVIGDEEEPEKFGKRTYNTGPK